MNQHPTLGWKRFQASFDCRIGMGLTIDLVLGLGFFPAVRLVLCDCLHAGVASTASSSAANIQEQAHNQPRISMSRLHGFPGSQSGCLHRHALVILLIRRPC